LAPTAFDFATKSPEHTLMKRTKIEGSCLCGGIRYQASGPLEAMARCHCRECRKASGAEFATNGTVATRDLEFTAGADLLREYESSPGQFRCFCGTCGSPILKKFADKPESVRLRLGCLDSDVDQKPIVRVWVSEKLDFSEIDGDIPTFDTVPGA